MSGERRRVDVALGERSYAIEIGLGTLGELGAAVKRVVAPTRAFLITTPPVGRRWAGRALASLRQAGLRARRFEALDLVPTDRAVTRERLIAALCPIHERDGARLNMGLGIYAGRRFHVDARSYRGWGADYHAATFPCWAAPEQG